VIGLDTNILVRYIAQDDKTQSPLATRVVETQCSATDPGFVAQVVLAEVVWVSESRYGATRAEVAQIVRRVLGIRQLRVQDAEIAWQALRAFETGKADFADCLIERTAAAAGCERILSFDKKAGMTLLTG